MIKKLLYGFAIIAGFASCNDDYTDWANPQSNAAEEAVEKLVFTVQPSVSSIDFATETAENIQLFTTNLQADQTNEYTVTFSAEDKTNTAVLTATKEGKLAVADLQAAVVSIYGKAPLERTLAVEVKANVTITTGNGAIVAEKKASPFTLKTKLDSPHISTAYYIVGDHCGWNAAGMMKFNHSDKDVYEDPVFTIMITTNKADSYWKIIPQENVDAAATNPDDFWKNPGVVGPAVNGDPALEGILLNKDAQAGKIEAQGMYLMTINMMDYTYSIKPLVPEYYVVGAMQGWNSNAEGMTCMLYPQSVMVHSYTTAFTGDGNLKLWLGSDFGNWDVCYGAAQDGDNATSGSLVGTNAGAIVCPEKSTEGAMVYYTFTADFATMTYAWTKLENQTPASYEKIGLIGDFNDWGGDLEMREVTPHNWYAAGLTVEAGKVGIKFRANGKWDTSWGVGGDLSHDLSVDNYGVATTTGGNLKIAAGVYNVFFNDITGEFVFVTVE